MKSIFSFSLIFYISVFLLAFGRFLPVPFYIGFLHDFFSNYGFVLTYLNIIPLIGFFIFRLIQSFRLNSHNRYEIVLGFSALIIYVCFWFLIPTFKSLNHQLIIFANKQQAVENFSNLVLGYQMKIRTACDFGSTFTPMPNNSRGTIVTQGVKEGTIISDKPCETIKYAVFESYEFGITKTIDKVIYLPPEVKFSEIKYFGDLRSDYKNGWYYVQWSATLKLF